MWVLFSRMRRSWTRRPDAWNFALPILVHRSQSLGLSLPAWNGGLAPTLAKPPACNPV